MRSWMNRIALLTLLTAAGLSFGCYEFHLVGPEDPDPVTPPQTVSLTIEYQQPPFCLTDSTACQQPVVFYGSWMRSGAQFSLVREAGRNVWRGTAYAVPVNFPPRGEPYDVHVFDPVLQNDPCEGMTAQRLAVGGETLIYFADESTPKARAFLYIDSNGHGRNVY
jgi:hypothetical protein